MSPTKEPTETQRALASRMQHLFNSGHPSHVADGALRLIVEHDEQLTARAEAAESLAKPKDDALRGLLEILDMAIGVGMIPDTSDEVEKGPRAQAFRALALNPDSMVSKLAELERLRIVCQEQLAKLEEIHALRARVSDLDKRTKERALICNELLSRAQKAEQRAERLADALWECLDERVRDERGDPDYIFTDQGRTQLTEKIKAALADQPAQKVQHDSRGSLDASTLAYFEWKQEVMKLRVDDHQPVLKTGWDAGVAWARKEGGQPAQANTREAALIAAGGIGSLAQSNGPIAKHGSPIADSIIANDTGDSGLIHDLAAHGRKAEELLRELFVETGKLRFSILANSRLMIAKSFGWWDAHTKTMLRAETYLKAAKHGAQPVEKLTGSLAGLCKLDSGAEILSPSELAALRKDRVLLASYDVALNPRVWTDTMRDAWNAHIPDMMASFSALKDAARKQEDASK
jgi:hypothetical protein